MPEIRFDDLALIKQWTKVLRLSEGDCLILCDGKGREAEAIITEISRSSITLKPRDPHAVAAEPNKDVTLYCSILKRENFEWVVQKCTEIGVKKIAPIVAARTVKTGLKMDRLRAIAKEAAEQSGRGIVPTITETIEFSRALEEAKNKTNIFFHTVENKQTSKRSNQQTVIGIWVGPEGGWTEEEVQAAKKAGAQIASLGKLTLRAETAAVVGCSIALGH